MNRLLAVIALLITALQPANRRQDSPHTAQANGPQALPAVELPRQTAPAPSNATEATPGQTRRASTPDHDSKPRGACRRGPPPTTDRLPNRKLTQDRGLPDPDSSGRVGTGWVGSRWASRQIIWIRARSQVSRTKPCRDGTGRGGLPASQTTSLIRQVTSPTDLDLSGRVLGREET
jgi:hypothetical protein